MVAREVPLGTEWGRGCAYHPRGVVCIVSMSGAPGKSATGSPVADPVHTTCVVVNSVCGGATVSNDHLQQMVMCDVHRKIQCAVTAYPADSISGQQGF